MRGFPILSMKTLSGHLEQGLERWMVETGASIFTALGGVAVLLALVGVYGVKSYLVSRRTREIGIRMALGATPRDVLSWMLYDGLPSTVVGLGVGVLLALGIGRVLSSALYGIERPRPGHVRRARRCSSPPRRCSPPICRHGARRAWRRPRRCARSRQRFRERRTRGRDRR